MNLELKIARLRAGLSQHRLSMITGIAQTLISLFEQGYRKPNDEQAGLIPVVQFPGGRKQYIDIQDLDKFIQDNKRRIT